MKTGEVFVSHTSDMAAFPEGRSFVQAVLDAVSRAGMAPVDMRYFAAREGKPADYCRARVRECEVYVAVVGFRYGSMVPGEAVSYTELEFGEASTAGLPRLVFLLDGTADMPAGLVDADRGAVEGFRQRLRDAGLVVRGFASDAGLELEVFHALAEVAGSIRSAAPGALAVRYSLPPDTAAFTGRAGELGVITAAVTDAAGAGGVVAIHAIGGMPGVGKTALAVHAARLLRGRFPDRQLFIDLHAHTPGQDPVLPETALAGLLAAVGVDPRYLPEDLAGRAGLWRDRMAGQRALLVLDNAAGSTQVTPLLPGGEGCLVLVTSRRHLGDLPGAVVPVQVDALPPDQAQAMFVRLAPHAAAGPKAAVAELVRLAGCLPLAISLLARVYARHPSWTLADLIRETQASLLTLAAEKASVAAAFEVSYRYLIPARQRFFRRLGLHPGTTIDAYAAAALAGLPLDEAAGLLDALHGEGLLTEAGYRRYGMHDLIRRYAHDLAAADPAAERDAAVSRLLDYYLHTARAADRHLARRNPAGVPAVIGIPPACAPDLSAWDDAVTWMDAERLNLSDAVGYAALHGLPGHAVAIPAAMHGFLRTQGHWVLALTLHHTALQSARDTSDQLAEAGALTDLGGMQRMTGDYPAATASLTRALELYRDLGDRLGEVGALFPLGVVHRLTGNYRAAAASLARSQQLYRDLGDRLGEANTLNELGVVQHLTGDYPAAATSQAQALKLLSGLGDRLGQANALTDLGIVQHLTGDYPAAAASHTRALELYRDLGNQLGEANALNNLAVAQYVTGQYPAATASLVRALALCRVLGDRLGEANVLSDLGAVHSLTGDYAAATASLTRALALFGDIGSRHGEASALNNLAVVQRLTGDYRAAAANLTRALELVRDLGNRIGEAEVLNSMGELALESSTPAEAQVHHEQALAIAIATGIASQLEEARALEGIGRCHLQDGQPGQSTAPLRQALAIYRRIGSPNAQRVETTLRQHGL